MQSPVTVRPARVEDKDAIVSFCQNTFRWGDYIPEVWDDWIADARGRIFVGVVDDQPIGMTHVAFLGDGAAWMEGMRVHPAHRRRGVAAALVAAGHNYARTAGHALARLATDSDNIAAQKTLASQGYTRVAEYGEWGCESIGGMFLPVATEKDLAEILAQWRTTSSAIIGDPEWHWTKLGDKGIADLVHRDQIRVAPRGFSVFCESRDASGVSLFALAGDDDARLALAQSARTEARYRGYARVEAVILDDARINRALELAGFKRDGALFIYEKSL